MCERASTIQKAIKQRTDAKNKSNIKFESTKHYFEFGSTNIIFADLWVQSSSANSNSTLSKLMIKPGISKS